MTGFYEAPISQLLAGLLLLAGTWLAALGARLVAGALRHGRALDLVRGIRVGILGAVAGIFAVGVLSAQTGFIIMGALILGEELYETGILALIIRQGEELGGASNPRLGSGPGS